MWKGYIRQRRRIAVTMLLSFLAVIVGFVGQAAILMRITSWFPGPPVLAGLQAGLATMVAIFIAMSFVLHLAPTQRRQCEVLAAATLIFEAFGLFVTGIGAPFASPLLAVCAFVLIALMIDGILYGRTLDVFGLWRPLAASEVFEVEATPHAAWNAILPRPDTVSTHWIGALHEVARTREPDVFIARYRLGDGTELHKTLTTLSEQHPIHMRYHFEPEADDDESRFGAGFYEVWLDENGATTDVTITCEYTALRLRVALQLWFDDWLGSEADAIQAYIERRPDRSFHTKLWGDVLRQAA